jgi:uroporphyrinogen decarboxylase
MRSTKTDKMMNQEIARFDHEAAGRNARLALDALAMKPTRGIPSWMFHTMDIAYLEHKSGHPPGSYRADPDTVYLDFQRAAGTCMIDQYLADNPLSMGAHGFESGAQRAATTGAETIVLDGITIDSPEAVVEHMERFVFPDLKTAIAAACTDDESAALLRHEREMQARFGPEILKVPHDIGWFPALRYGAYGYANYLTAYLVYPEVMEKDFILQSRLAEKHNAIAARAIVEGGLPGVLRLDHDMADSRGTLVDVRSLDRIWFPYFARSVGPLLEAGIRLLWHCDGNLMEMVPRLIEAGIGGFQGFQYEDGMDYERICRMSTRDGAPLMIWAGVSVTRTLPFGTPADVRSELEWLVRHGPHAGLFLGGSSSITPGVPWENLDALIEGLAHYRNRGRSG